MQYIKDLFHGSLEFVHHEVQQLSKEQWSSGINGGTHLVRDRKGNSSVSISVPPAKKKSFEA